MPQGHGGEATAFLWPEGEDSKRREEFLYDSVNNTSSLFKKSTQSFFQIYEKADYRLFYWDNVKRNIRGVVVVS